MKVATPPRLAVEGLPEDLRRRVEALREVGREADHEIYLVGGFVRDLLLGRLSRDLDIVVDGDLRHLAPRVAAALGGRVRAYTPFLTAILEAPDGASLDVAAFRRESYPRMAALPEVAPGRLAEDLFRRDFTVNALAWRLWPDAGAEGAAVMPIDLYGGLADLARRTLRTLHPRSFFDDPTRALRGVRFAERLGFELDPQTRSDLAAAVVAGAFEALSGSRLRHELELTLDDPQHAAGCLQRLGELGILPRIDPALLASPEVVARAEATVTAWQRFGLVSREPRPPLSEVLLLTLAEGLAPDARARLAGRLGLLGERRQRLVEEIERLADLQASLADPGLRPHRADELLHPLSSGLRLLLSRQEGAARGWVERFERELRAFELAIRGGDLLAAGVAPGPGLGRALLATRRARLDGEIPAEAELSYALDHARRLL